MHVWIGIDVGGQSAKFGLFDAKGSLLDTDSLPTGKEKEPEAAIHEMALHVRALVARHEDAELSGIGVGVPGPVLEENIVNKCVNLDWDVVPVADLFQQEGFTCPVKVENDANVAALGELWQGAAVGHTSILFIVIGTGVGGGVVINGKVVSGVHGAGGEIGHMPILAEKAERTCGCGGHHCLELAASAPAIADLARRLLAETEEASLLRDQEISAKEVFDAARAQDPLAQRVVAQAAEVLGRAIAILTSTVDPEMVVLGGGVSEAGETLLKPVRDAYRKAAFYALQETPIVRAELGNRAGMVGAAYLVLQ